MQTHTGDTPGLTRQWADGVQDRWEYNGRRFLDDELERIRQAAGTLPGVSTGVPAVSAPQYVQLPTAELLTIIDNDTEAGWELIVRVISTT